ncbi:MAG: hypothetical protein QOK05_2756 [Chloroflexota bacterium]|jgi:hypothetical protein|nr:hypothetical protein [Chloroflexota bacterium]
MAFAPLPPPEGVQPSSGRGVLILVAVLVVVLLVIAGGVMTAFYFSYRALSSARPHTAYSAVPGTDPGNGDTSTGGQGQSVDGVRCNSKEQLVSHDHAHLYILSDGVQQPVSARVGIPGAAAANCFYWLHTHDRTGIIHMESPSATRTYTLGEFFDIWGQPLSPTRVARLQVPGGKLAAFVDGERYSGDIRQISLHAHTEVVIEIGREVPPPTYDLSGY